jgi:hypothetical protein
LIVAVKQALPNKLGNIDADELNLKLPDGTPLNPRDPLPETELDLIIYTSHPPGMTISCTLLNFADVF